MLLKCPESYQIPAIQNLQMIASDGSGGGIWSSAIWRGYEGRWLRRRLRRRFTIAKIPSIKGNSGPLWERFQRRLFTTSGDNRTGRRPLRPNANTLAHAARWVHLGSFYHFIGFYRFDPFFPQILSVFTILCLAGHITIIINARNTEVAATSLCEWGWSWTHRSSGSREFPPAKGWKVKKKYDMDYGDDGGFEEHSVSVSKQSESRPSESPSERFEFAMWCTFWT